MEAYLESSKLVNVPFYEKHGFRTFLEFRPNENAPLVYLMHRERKSVRDGGGAAHGASSSADGDVVIG